MQLLWNQVLLFQPDQMQLFKANLLQLSYPNYLDILLLHSSSYASVSTGACAQTGAPEFQCFCKGTEPWALLLNLLLLLILQNYSAGSLPGADSVGSLASLTLPERPSADLVPRHRRRKEYNRCSILYCRDSKGSTLWRRRSTRGGQSTPRMRTRD